MFARAAADQIFQPFTNNHNREPTAMQSLNILARGQKLRLPDLTTSTRLTVGVGLQAPAGVALDTSCFGVDAADKLSDDRYFIFYNQKKSQCGSIMIIDAAEGEAQRFSVELAQLPQAIRKLVFVVTLDGAQDMSCLGDSYLRLLDNGRELARFGFSSRDFSKEKAVIVAEIYHKDVWRFAAVGQGFNGGLSALLKHFGGEEKAEPPQIPPVQPVPPPVSTPPATPKLNLGKITLEKKGDKQTVDLRKGGGVQPIAVNLNWDNPGAEKRGFFGGSQASPDLDLGCMYRLKSGEIGVIQPLGKSFGARDYTPFIFLDKDDRSGAAADGENLTIFRPDLIDLVVVFAMVYSGASDFTEVAARLTLRDQEGNEIFMRLGCPDKKLNFCAICTIRNAGQRVEITKEEHYFRGHREADQHFGFGFTWTTGSK
jgi:tellurite resistance protein TerA